MADLTITSVRPVRFANTDHACYPAGEAITEGQYIRLDPTAGKWMIGNATTTTETGTGQGYIADHDAAAGVALTGWRAPALVDVGDALDGMDFDDPVYLSDTDGTLADSAGTVSLVLGYVAPAFGSTTPDKLLQLVERRT